MATATDTLLTAEDFRRQPDAGCPTELVRGRIVAMNPPGFRHGAVCGNVVYLVRSHVDRHDLGRVVCNDAGVVTEREPDTVRGMDAGFYSYARLPRERNPEGYPDVAPEVVFEVRSPFDRWSELLAKVAEYLNAGVLRVCVLDPPRRTLTVYSPDEPEERLAADDTFELPDLLPGFAVPVSRFFE